ncbi:MAG: tRNA preQ1(34) S-adenosylmethionine ribosyltransferase-isomerase QueA [Acidimicrobiales bacterium]
METSAFDYELPESAIAQRPLPERDAARLLVDCGAGVAPEHHVVRELPDLLDPGDLLVLNTTRVLPARLALRKETGAAVEVLLLERLDGGSLSDNGRSRWEALVRPGRKLPPGTIVRPERGSGLEVSVDEDLGDGRRVVTIDVEGPLLDVLEQFGVMPLPPYITEMLAEQERYQTVFAERPASAAAPTAGLHLTAEILERCAEKGIGRADVELVVGLGTFRPIASDHVEQHIMHGEEFHVPQTTIDACIRTKANGGRVVAVGTTAVRALESAAALGVNSGRTELFIHGNYDFVLVDRMMTNFHLPKSSLIVMIDAFIGPRWRELYAEALAEDYRFLSFGDAMLLTHQRG